MSVKKSPSRKLAPAVSKAKPSAANAPNPLPKKEPGRVAPLSVKLVAAGKTPQTPPSAPPQSTAAPQPKTALPSKPIARPASVGAVVPPVNAPAKSATKPMVAKPAPVLPTKPAVPPKTAKREIVRRAAAAPTVATPKPMRQPALMIPATLKPKPKAVAKAVRRLPSKAPTASVVSVAMPSPVPVAALPAKAPGLSPMSVPKPVPAPNQPNPASTPQPVKTNKRTSAVKKSQASTTAAPQPPAVPVKVAVPAAAKPVQAEAPKPAAKPVQPEAPKPAAKPVQPEALKPAAKPIQPEALKPAAKPIQAEAPKPAAKPVPAEAPKPAAKPVQAEAPKAAAKPVQVEAPKPSAKPVQPEAPKAAAKPVQVEAPKPAAKPVQAEAPKAAPKATAKRAKSTAKPQIPSILLEGDHAPVQAVSGPGQRYALGPGVAEPPYTGEEPGDLPDSYGTKRLLLTARDPHWVYAHWDLTREQQRQFNSLSATGHLTLRVYEVEVGGRLAALAQVHPESRHWFVHVGKGGMKYVAELGYETLGGQWITVSTSGGTLTPPDSLSDDTSVQFATLPTSIPLPKLAALVKELALEHVSLVQAIQELRAQGHIRLPAGASFATHVWTPEQERALAEVISMDEVRRVWIGSLEITELIRRRVAGDLSSQAAAQITSPVGAFGSISSPFGGEQKRKGFWFNVNAELIIYGATETDASVSIGGRKIKLRPDGSFSYRFALPDGQYPLPAVATSADGTDKRWADLHFSRATQYGGEVGTHPQDTKLKPPLTTSL